jgi:inner membrane protease subunit 1
VRLLSAPISRASELAARTLGLLLVEKRYSILLQVSLGQLALTGLKQLVCLHLCPLIEEAMSKLWSRRSFEPRGAGRFLLSITKYYFILDMFATHVCEPRQGAGFSMLPTLAGGGEWNLKVSLPFYRFVSSLSSRSIFGQSGFSDQQPSPNFYAKGSISKTLGLVLGDLVVYTSPNDPTKQVCKRVIGLPGDTVLVEPRIEPPEDHALEWSSNQNKLKRVQREDLKSDSEPTYILVPKGHIWTTGDNLANSIDSRHYGPVPLGLVKGIVVAKVFPLRIATWLTKSTVSPS